MKLAGYEMASNKRRGDPATSCRGGHSFHQPPWEAVKDGQVKRQASTKCACKRVCHTEGQATEQWCL